MKPHITPNPIEFSFTTSTFNLELQSTQDGARLEHERLQLLADRDIASKNQILLHGTTTPPEP